MFAGGVARQALPRVHDEVSERGKQTTDSIQTEIGQTIKKMTINNGYYC